MGIKIGMLLLLLVSCGPKLDVKPDAETSTQEKSEETKNQESEFLEGTLSRITDFLIPSAMAEDCSKTAENRYYDLLSCFPVGKDSCDGNEEACVFLVGDNGELLGNAKVANGSYRLELLSSLEDDALYHLVGEKLDDASFLRKEVFSKEEKGELLEVSVETTLSAEEKADQLRQMSERDIAAISYLKDDLRSKVDELLLDGDQENLLLESLNSNLIAN
jgi:hypothetical protein